MRKRANLDKRMERCAALLIGEPETLRGRWMERFPGYGRLYLELGCGKGRFTADTAETMPDTLYVALERVPDAMILAMERVARRGIENVRFLDADAKNLKEMFADGEVARLYINFCDPWPKSRDAKLRLTAPGFLRLYGDLLPAGGQIHFKTDNNPLFRWSIAQFEAEGWELSEVTEDLHAGGIVGVMTDYEAKFTAQGMKINRLVATKTEGTKGSAAGPVPRLRNASLTDAKGYDESVEANRRGMET
jgi:tRNA (guanine-N7-)-methyltransferase